MGCKKIERVLGTAFHKYGRLLGHHPFPFLICPLIFAFLIGPGLIKLKTDEDLAMLFTPYNAPSRREQQIARQFSATAPLPSNCSEFSLPLTSPEPYTDLWFQLTVMSEQNLMTQHDWSLIADYVDYLYNNFTCRVDYWVDEDGPMDTDGSDRILQYRRDFCNPDRGCVQVDSLVHHLRDLLNTTKFGNNSKVHLTYPVMSVWDHPFNWGRYIFGVDYHPETGLLQSAHIVVFFFQFQVNAVDERARHAAQSCVREFTKYTLRLNSDDPVKRAGLQFFPINEPYVTDEVNRLSDLLPPYLTMTILLILAFIGVTSFRRQFPLTSLLGSGMGLFTVGLSLLASFGLLSLCGVHMNFVVTVTPFLVLCVGIDNDFLLTSSWRRTEDGKSSVPNRMARAFADCGPSLTITSINDILCFGIGYMSETPAVADFCLHTSVALVFRFLFQLTFFAAVLVYTGRKESRGERTWPVLTLCRYKSKSDADPLPPKTIPAALMDFVAVAIGPEPEPVEQHHRIHQFFRQYYSSFLMTKTVRVVTIFLYLAYLLAAIIGTATWKIDISTQKMFYDDSPVLAGINEVEKLARGKAQSIIGQVYVTAPPDFRNKSQVNRFFQFVHDLENLDDPRFVFNLTIGRKDITELWLRQYVEFLQYVIPSDPTSETGDQNDYQSDFYDYLPSFLQSADYSQHLNSLRFKRNGSDPEASPRLDQFRFIVSYFRGPQYPFTYQDHVNLLLGWRAVCGNYSDYEAVVFDQGQLNSYFDQWLTLAPTCLQTMGIALLSVSAVTALLMPNVRGMFFICLSFLSVDVGVIGGLNFWWSDLDTVSVAFVLMTIGFSVYYTARVCYCYQSSPVDTSSEEKMRYTMDKVGWPIVQGALATAIGVAPVIFVNCYTNRVFYRTVFLVVLIGLVHGLLIMPVLMHAFDLHRSPIMKHRRIETGGRKWRSGGVTPPSTDTLSECSNREQ